MPFAKATAILGAVLLAAGLALFVYVSAFTAPYPGASGAGVAGLHAAMRMLAALALIGLGAVSVLIALLVHAYRTRARGEQRR